jgi:hypothetical protein
MVAAASENWGSALSFKVAQGKSSVESLPYSSFEQDFLLVLIVDKFTQSVRNLGQVLLVVKAVGVVIDVAELVPDKDACQYRQQSNNNQVYGHD